MKKIIGIILIVLHNFNLSLAQELISCIEIVDLPQQKIVNEKNNRTINQGIFKAENHLKNISNLNFKVINSITKEPIQFAEIIVDTNKVITRTDSAGNFNLSKLSNYTETLYITAFGFDSIKIDLTKINFKTNDETIFELKPNFKKLSEVVIFTIVCSTSKSLLICGLYKIKEHKLNSINSSKINSLKVYPNPIQKGSTLNIDFGEMNTGNYQLSFFDMAGKIIFIRNIRIQNKNQKESFQLNSNLSSGTYIIRLLNDDKQQIFSSKLMVL